MIKIFICCASLVMILGFSFYANTQELMDGIVAIVGDEIILRTEWIQATQAFSLRMRINPADDPEAFEKLKRDMIQNLINEKAILAKAREDTITVNEQRVEAELENRIQTLVQQLGSEEKVEAYFGSPIKKIKRDYRDDIRNNLIVQTAQAKKVNDIQISRREVERFYETMKDSLPSRRPTVKLRHILMDVRPGGEARIQAEEKLLGIRERILQGENFEELAALFSEDPGTAQNGGSLGFIEKGTLFQSFDKVAFELEPGQISDVVESPVGLHLIQTLEKRGDRANVRHILIRLEISENDEESVYQTLVNLRNQINEGEDFSELAKEYSDDQSTKGVGGDLGYLPLEDLQIAAFKNAVDTLEIGEITYPFRTTFGYHIVRLEEKREGRKLLLDEDWDQIHDFALNLKRQRVIQEWIEEIKKDLYIKIKEDML